MAVQNERVPALDRRRILSQVSDVEPAAEATETGDPLREQLLDAACRVFSAKGYAGTKIMDIVREAGLSSGAVYGRYASKNDLLMEAILTAVEQNAFTRRFRDKTVNEILVETNRSDTDLDDVEAMQIEAFSAARREPQVAAAITAARARWRTSRIEELIHRAIEDGSASANADFDSIVYFIETLQLGLLVQRGAGQHAPDESAWQAFLGEVISRAAHPDAGP